MKKRIIISNLLIPILYAILLLLPRHSGIIDKNRLLISEYGSVLIVAQFVICIVSFGLYKVRITRILLVILFLLFTIFFFKTIETFNPF